MTYPIIAENETNSSYEQSYSMIVIVGCPDGLVPQQALLEQIAPAGTLAAALLAYHDGSGECDAVEDERFSARIIIKVAARNEGGMYARDIIIRYLELLERLLKSMTEDVTNMTEALNDIAEWSASLSYHEEE